MLLITCGAGGAPAVMMVTLDKSCPSEEGSDYIEVKIVGAQHI